MPVNQTHLMPGDHETPDCRIVLVRHGQTEWSATGRHTGRTDVALNDVGRGQASALEPALAGYRFVRVLTSPRSRASDTCRLALPGQVAEVDADLDEWDYGDYEGLTTVEIQKSVPGWTVWTHPCPGGESLAAIGVRADRVLQRCRDVDGDVLLVAHGHLLRVLAARWLGLAPIEGRRLLLDPATVSALGHERGVAAVASWNSPAG